MEHDSVGAQFTTDSSAASHSSAEKRDITDISVPAEAGNEKESDFLIQQNSDLEEIGLNALLTVAANAIANSLIQSPDSFNEQDVSTFVSSVNELASKLKDASQANVDGTPTNENVHHLKSAETSRKQPLYPDDLNINDGEGADLETTDPEAFLFSCDRCNFQTNVEKEMIRHLHSKLSRCDANPNKKS